jgi:hypothetical protein
MESDVFGIGYCNHYYWCILIGKIPAGIIAQVWALGAEYSQDYRSLAIFPSFLHSLDGAVACNGSLRWAHRRAPLPTPTTPLPPAPAPLVDPHGSFGGTQGVERGAAWTLLLPWFLAIVIANW